LLLHLTHFPPCFLEVLRLCWSLSGIVSQSLGLFGQLLFGSIQAGTHGLAYFLARAIDRLAHVFSRLLQSLARFSRDRATPLEGLLHALASPVQ
jgi:hypothetical protein